MRCGTPRLSTEKPAVPGVLRRQRTEPKKLSKAREQFDTEQACNQGSHSLFVGCSQAGRILNSNALETLQTWFQPAADSLDSETSDGVDDALAGLLKDEVPYVVEFLSDKQFPGPICRAFWQSELYLRDFQQVAGQAPLEEFTQTAKHVTDKIQEDIGGETQALDRLVTRQQFGAAARFGYFLRRAKQRLRLESIM